jgi:hypothetical protein
MIHRPFLPLLLIVLAWPAAAQQRSVVVPADASIAVPARGAAPVASPGMPRRARRVVSERVLQAPRPAETGTATSLLVSVPLGIAAGVLAATLGGGGSGGGGVSAPARTR